MSKALLKCVPNPHPCLYMCCFLPSHGYLYLACVNMYIHMELYMYINNVPLCIRIYLRLCMLAMWSKYSQWHKHLQICRRLMIPMQPFCFGNVSQLTLTMEQLICWHQSNHEECISYFFVLVMAMMRQSIHFGAIFRWWPQEGRAHLLWAPTHFHLLSNLISGNGCDLNYANRRQ